MIRDFSKVTGRKVKWNARRRITATLHASRTKVIMSYSSTEINFTASNRCCIPVSLIDPRRERPAFYNYTSHAINYWVFLRFVRLTNNIKQHIIQIVFAAAWNNLRYVKRSEWNNITQDMLRKQEISLLTHTNIRHNLPRYLNYKTANSGFRSFETNKKNRSVRAKFNFKITCQRWCRPTNRGASGPLIKPYRSTVHCVSCSLQFDIQRRLVRLVSVPLRSCSLCGVASCPAACPQSTIQTSHTTVPISACVLRQSYV